MPSRRRESTARKKCGQRLYQPEAVQTVPGPRFGSAESYTPKHVAEKILISRSAFEDERKQVTMPFVDVSGFTLHSERLDPEDVHRLMSRAFELGLRRCTVTRAR